MRFGAGRSGQMGKRHTYFPISRTVRGAAATRGTAKWLILVLEVASIPLLLLGFFASAAV
jgi:hypothetical protein